MRMNPSNSEAPSHIQALPAHRPTRRRFLATGICTAAAAALGVTYHGFREARQLSFNQVMISVRKLPHEFEGCTIAHLSDFHYHPVFSAKAIREAVYLVNRLNPYIVVLTGDFVTVAYFSLRHKSKLAIKAQAEPCAELLSRLRPKGGIFAVLGNHDQSSQPDVVMDSLQGRGIRVLRNEAVPLQKVGKRLWIAGVDDVLADSADLDMALRNIPSQEPTILLAHEPDFADVVAQSPVDVQLSGHSHGGQIRLPFIGPPYLPELARKYPWGLRQVGELNLYTNCGLGTIEVPVRLNCPPEVTLIRLVRRGV